MAKINKILSGYILATLVVVFGFVLIQAVNAQSVLQGYATDEKLQKGMLVALKDGDESKVVALTDKNAKKFKGVVVDKNDSPVTISNDDRKTFVATSGPYDVLVTNENGSIKKGDYIVVSSNSGIGAKATESQDYVVGVAVGDFNGGGDALSSTSKNTTVGLVRMDVSFGKNPAHKTNDNGKVPSALKKISEAIADKPVNSARIYVGLAIFSITSAITAVMVYSGVRNAVVSIGRNPLSKGKIIKGLIQVVILGLIIFIVGLFGVYLVLKL